MPIRTGVPNANVLVNFFLHSFLLQTPLSRQLEPVAPSCSFQPYTTPSVPTMKAQTAPLARLTAISVPVFPVSFSQLPDEGSLVLLRWISFPRSVTQGLPYPSTDTRRAIPTLSWTQS
jgi:hypothetical protein